MKRLCSRETWAVLVILSTTCASAGLADTIIQPTGPAASSLDTSSSPEGNTTSENLGYTTIDDQNISNLGLDPGTFLFEPNNFFNFTGTEIVTILQAYVNPSQNSLPLNSPGSLLVTFSVPDGSGDPNSTSASSTFAALPADTQNSAPEPGAGYLLGGGLTTLFLLAVFRDRRLKRAPLPIMTRSPRAHDTVR
jgi:hypothetical protein